MLFPVGRGIASWSVDDGMSRECLSHIEMELR
jgi:hypothetical protein